MQKWLEIGMFNDDIEKEAKARKIVENLNEHENKKTHSRHIHIDECKDLGLKILELDMRIIVKNGGF